MGANPAALTSTSGIPRARSLYGTLPEQLADEQSFARQLARILTVRKRLGIATGVLLDVPPPSHPAVLIMVNRIAQNLIQVTVLNFSAADIDADVVSEHLVPGAPVLDGLDETYRGVIDDRRHLTVPLAGYQGRALVLEPAPARPDVAVDHGKTAPMTA